MCGPTRPVYPLGELLPLLGGEHVGDVGERLGEALRRLVGQLELAGPQGLERGPIDARLRQEGDGLPPGVPHPLSLRQQVAGGRLHDRPQLLLLGVGGVHLSIQVVEHPVEVLVQPGRVEMGAHETAAVPPTETVAVSEGLEADPGGEDGKGGDDDGPPEEAAAPGARGGGGGLRSLDRVSHG